MENLIFWKQNVLVFLPYTEEKQGHFVLKRNNFVYSRSGAYYTLFLVLLVWNYYQTFVIVCIEFWLRFEPQIRPTRFVINFLFITARTGRKVRLFVKLFWFFPRWIVICFPWKLSRFVPNSILILPWNSNKKLFWENFSNILCKPRLSSKKFVKLHLTFCNFILGSSCIEKFQKNSHKMHPSKETRP